MTPEEILTVRGEAAARARSKPRGPALDAAVDTRAADLGVRIYRPQNAVPDAVWVFLHGGYFVLGSLDHQDLQCRVIARATGAQVISVDYPWAPEHGVTETVERVAAALREIQAMYPGCEIHLWGDSAGGTVAVLSMAQGLGPEVNICGAILTNPNLDLTMALFDADATGGPDQRLLRAGIDAWAGDSEMCNPLDVGIPGVCRIVLAVGSEDSLLPEARVFAHRHPDRVEILELPGLAHGFFGNDDDGTSATLGSAVAMMAACGAD